MHGIEDHIQELEEVIGDYCALKSRFWSSILRYIPNMAAAIGAVVYTCSSGVYSLGVGDIIRVIRYPCNFGR